MIATADGGYLLAGSVVSDDGDVQNNRHPGATDAWVVKLNSSRNIVWQKTFGGSGYESAGKILPTADGGFVLIGTTNSGDGDVTGYHGGDDIWIFKVNSSGNLVWQRALGGSLSDRAGQFNATSDGGFILVGGTDSNDGDVTDFYRLSDAWLVKLTATGNLAWNRALGGARFDDLRSLVITSDKGYVMAGATRSNEGEATDNHGIFDLWAIKVLEPLQVLPPVYNCSTGQITFRTSGGSSAPISFTAPGISRSSATARQGTVEAGVRNDPKVIPITAIQNGLRVTYNFDLKAACSNQTPPLAPRLLKPIPIMVMTSGLELPGQGIPLGPYFVDPTPNTPNYSSDWSFQIEGLPNGLSFFPGGLQYSPLAALQGPVFAQPGDYPVTIRASTAAFRNLPITTSFIIRVYPGGPLALQAPFYDCSNGAFHFNTSGGNGSPIEFNAAGITGWTTNPDQFVDANLRNDPNVKPFTLQARQNGVTVSYVWDLKAACGRTVSSAEADAGFQVVVLGNPASGSSLDLEIRGAGGKAVLLTLVNEQGQMLHQKQLVPVGSAERVRIPLGTVQGVYLLRAGTPDAQQVVRVVKP